ncbi:MAG: ATP-binding protein, partial [Candidatus Rokuibacteriota bacterium]
MSVNAMPPTGTVTFLFTDVEGSTRLWQRSAPAMTAALARHHALLQHAVDSHGGYVFQIVGDGVCAAFPTAPAALAAVLTAQRALILEPWGETGPIRVRMALHTGTAEVRAGDHRSGEYVSGLTLSRVARLLSAGHGGQILVSHATQALTRDHLPSGVELRDLGERWLRDLVRPERIFQLVAPDLPAEFPPLRSLDAVPNNLPVQLTSFVGRARELADVERLLAETRLLTLVGPGGTGKTRLALQVAADLVDRFPDGIWLVELAPLSDPALVPQAVAVALGLREEAGRPVAASLTHHLRPKRLLLVLDNCEHLVDACARLADALVRACPQLTILASGQETLGVTGERLVRVPPLSLPDPRRLPPPARLVEYGAIRLFMDRATAVKPEFALTAANASAVVQICQQLDGIPLAIELAAARLKALSPQQIAGHLDERFRLLTGGSRSALPRHQTLRGLIDWSYGLLSPAEQALLRRLAVFAGGWGLEAAEAVTAGDGVDAGEVLELIGRLVDKSLVMADEQSEEVRYRLLETIRRYAGQRLEERAEADATRDRHRDFFLGLAEEAEPELHGPDQTRWLRRLEAEHDNLRAALGRARERGDVETSLRLGAALWLFWDTRGHASEARESLDEILRRAAELPTARLGAVHQRARARVLGGAARMAARHSEFGRAKALYTESLELWRRLGDEEGTAETLDHLADLTHVLGDRPGAKALVEESLARFRKLGDRRGIAHALNNLADIVLPDDAAEAKRLCEESVPLFRETGDTRGLAHGLNNLGGILALDGDFRRAEAVYRESLTLAEELEDAHAVAAALRSLGGLARRRGDPVQARMCYEESVAGFLRMGDRHCAAQSLIGFGWAAHDAGDRARARALGEQCLALVRELGFPKEVALALGLLGRIALAEGHPDDAAAFLAESLVLQRGLQDRAGAASSLEALAEVASTRGDLE